MEQVLYGVQALKGDDGMRYFVIAPDGCRVGEHEAFATSEEALAWSDHLNDAYAAGAEDEPSWRVWATVTHRAGRVLARWADKTQAIAEWDATEHCWMWETADEDRIEAQAAGREVEMPTHWMPLPKDPEA